MTLAELKTQIDAMPYQHPLTETNVTLIELRGGNIYFESTDPRLDIEINSMKCTLAEIRSLTSDHL